METIDKTRQAPVAPLAADGRGGFLSVDDKLFRHSFSKSAFLVAHRLSVHPLFAIDRLLALARALPPEFIEYNSGELPINCDPAQTPLNGLSVEETIRRIEHCKSWMVIKYVQHDAAYQELLLQCLAEIRAHSDAVVPGMCLPEAFVFLSSPGALTPYHIDHEHNFLLQIRGAKKITVMDGAAVSAVELERFYKGAHRNLVYDEKYEATARQFELRPGVGIHVPVTFPHHVRVGNEVSISFSITFRTPDLYRRSNAHAFNAKLRASGFNPAAVGANPSRDALKSLAMRAWQRTSRVLRPVVKAP